MLRRLLALLLVAALAVVVAPAASAQTDDPAAEGSGDDPSFTPPAAAWVLADADSGAVLAAHNHHEPLFIASLAKVMTALVTVEQLQLSNTIEVSQLAASQQPMRIGMEAGQTWRLDHALHALLMVSANDAAYAMAEAAGGGSIEEFARLMQQTAQRLGMQDSTWLDPAGFDGDEGHGGGTTASAYDLAILARNALEVPEIAGIVGQQVYEFTDEQGVPHTLRNHNKMLDRFEGITGMKTGYTRAAGHTLIATAERDGRRLVAVIIDADDHYGTAAALLQQGFNTPADTPGIGEGLPPLAVGTPVEVPEPEEAAETTDAGSGTSAFATLRRFGALLLGALLVAFFARREQIKRRKRRRRAMRRAFLDARRRGQIEVIDPRRDAAAGTPAPMSGRTGHVQVYDGGRGAGPPNERGARPARGRHPARHEEHHPTS